RPAVDQEVPARDEARVGAADERAELAELRRVAEAAGGSGSVPVTHDLLDGAAARLRLHGDGRAQPVRVEGARQEVVDRHVMADGLAREPRDEAREPGARPVREPQDVDGVLTALDVMLTTRPKRRAIMPSTVALMRRIGASMFASSALIQVSRSQSRKSPGGGPPALFTRMSGAGHAASSAARPASVVTSPATAVTRTPAASRISFA